MISIASYQAATRKVPASQKAIFASALSIGLVLGRNDLRTVEEWLVEEVAEGGSGLSKAAIASLPIAELARECQKHLIAGKINGEQTFPCAVTESPEQDPKVTKAAMAMIQALAVEEAKGNKKSLEAIQSFIFRLFTAGCGEATESPVFLDISAQLEDKYISHPITFRNPGDTDGHDAYAAARDASAS